MQYVMYLYSADTIHIYSFKGLTGKRLVAYRSETAGQYGYIESRCSLECPAHGKADCVYASTVIGDLTAKSLLNGAEKKPSGKL